MAEFSGSDKDGADYGRSGYRSAARLMQGFILGAIVLACIGTGLALFRKEREEAAPDTGAAPNGRAQSERDRSMYAQPETAPEPEPGEQVDMALDLGEGVKMEFVWVKPLRMWVGKYEVTNQEYRRAVPGHKSGDFASHRLDGPRQPVVEVRYRNDVVDYVEWINATCLDQLPAGYRVRALREHEAQAILQCGDDRIYPWGDGWPPPHDHNYHGEESAGPIPRIAGHRDPWPVSCPVDESAPNDWGLHGVGGNVQEWIDKRRGSNHKVFTRDLLGGSWYFGNTNYLRCGYVPRLRHQMPVPYVGFRLAIGR